MHNDHPAPQTPAQSGQEWRRMTAFIKQALINTSQAFVAPTVAGALLPKPYRSLAFIPAGAILANQRLHPGARRFEPALTREQDLIAAGMGFSPFLLLLPLHAKYAHLDTPMGQKVRDTWARVTGKLRGPMGRWLHQYPVNFVFVRAMAQLGASALGASLAYQQITRSGSQYVVAKPVPEEPVTRARATQAMATGAALFSVPAVLGLPQVKSRVPGLRQMNATATTAFVTASLIAAALGTIAQVHPRTNRADSQT